MLAGLIGEWDRGMRREASHFPHFLRNSALMLDVLAKV